MTLIEDATLVSAEVRRSEMEHLLQCPHCDYDGDGESEAECVVDVYERITKAARNKALWAVVAYIEKNPYARVDYWIKRELEAAGITRNGD